MAKRIVPALLFFTVLSVMLFFGTGCLRRVERNMTHPLEQVENGTEPEQTATGDHHGEQNGKHNGDHNGEQSSGGIEMQDNTAGPDSQDVWAEVEKEIDELLNLLEELDYISDQDLDF